MNIFNLYTANLDGTKLIEASAGTGKTYTLSGLYIRYIVEKKLTPEQILVLTFTTAATTELKSRLREQLIQCKNHLLRIKLVDKGALYDLYESYRQKESAIKYIELALLCFDQSAIFTINGFCQKIIDDYNSDCGSPVFKELIVKKEEVKKIVYTFWRKQQKTTPQEFLAVIPPIDKVINKITGLLNKSHYKHIPAVIEWSKVQDIYDEYIDLAQQWKDQKDTLMDYLLSGDFHGGTYKVAQREKYVQDMSQFFMTMNTNVLKFCADYIESKLNKKKTLKPMPAFFVDFEKFYNVVNYTYKVGKAGNNIALSYMYACFQFVKQQLIKQRVEEGKFDYSDQINVVHQSINDNKNLVKKIAQQWQCIMVDEFQDTDGLQLNIFDQCFNDGLHDLIYVGDPKQAIYDFRGADVFVYNQAKEHTKNQYNLATNWRSSAEMLAVSNAMFDFQGSFKFPWLKFIPSMAKPDQQEQLTDIYPPLAIIDCALNERKSFLAHEITRFLQEASVNGEPIQPESCAILVNRNKDAIDLYEYLLSKNISTSLWSESGIFSTTVAKQLYYLLRALNYPSSTHIITVLHGLLFNKDLNQLSELDMEKVLAEFVDYRLQMNNSDIVTVMQKIFDDKKVYNRILQRTDGERHYVDLKHLLELIQQQVDLGKNHNHIEQWIAIQIQKVESMHGDDERKRRIESDSKKISIMTIHKSKGLEFDHVFIPYVDKVTDKIPNENINLRACMATHDDNNHGVLYWRHSKSAHANLASEKQAENMRNLYVAITRARHRVYLGLDTSVKGYEDLPINALINQVKNDENHCAFVIEKRIDEHLSAPSTIVLHKPKEFTRKLLKPQSIYSFSSLSRKQNIVHEIHDDDGHELDYDNYFHFPKGSRSGTMQHEILENITFNMDSAKISKEVEAMLNKYNFDLRWKNCLTEKVYSIVNTPLWKDGPRLSMVKNSIDEMEFMLPIGSINHAVIGLWLSEYRQADTPFDQDKLHGYLTGFIDLVFKFDDQYYVVDYKSNHLGYTYQDYCHNQLKQVIEHHYYDLQYLLYTVALVKYLRITVNGFDYDQHFGGVAYIFTRGVVLDKQGQGIYYDKPDKKLIDKMIEAFDVNGG